MSSTRYMVIADMDHMFSKNFEAKMISLAQKKLIQDPMTVLVYRIFEIADDVKIFPQTKNDLVLLMKNDTAKEFRKPYTLYMWEPQFVSLRTIPFHDTSFYYSTKDNTVLRWEMCRAGFKFAIVNDVFMFHLGYKTPKKEKLDSGVKKLVKKKALKSLVEFNQRMDRLYPETKSTCPKYKL
ncbi:hypothetical protein FO519_010243 [Halicephalobus sp. NKZ332]|nr:hypothetical protein FO519_010243 [Halicephalobus sp. NKZ332]